MPAAQVAPSALPPEEPTVPFEYLIRPYTAISNPDYLTAGAGTSQLCVSGRISESKSTRQAKSLAQQDIARFHVAVDRLVAMGGIQGRGNLTRTPPAPNTRLRTGESGSSQNAS